MKLSAESLRYQQGDFSLVADQIFSPGVYLITGRIGCGKSTLSLLLSGQLKPDSGIVRREEIRSEVLSLQFPEYHITGATVADEVLSWGVDPDMIRRDIIPAALLDQDPFSLSRGELKRLTLACAFAKKPDLLILDEPFSSLDNKMKCWLCEEIKRRRFGITIIFTHEREVLPEVENHLIMKDGHLLPGGEGEPVQNKGVFIKKDLLPPVIRDCRLRLLSVLFLSFGAFLSVWGALLALIWWSVIQWRRWEIPDKKILFVLLMMILLPALITEIFTGNGLSYGIRMGVILFISFWAYSEFRGGDMFDLFVSTLSSRLGFDIGLTGEMTMQGIHLAKSDIQQIQRAYAIKEMKFGWKTFIPAAITLLLLQIKRSDEVANLLAIRGFCGGGTYEPVFSPSENDCILLLFAFIILLFSIIQVW
jgi:energy-coupling factor transport system ATP-binding protein